MVWTLVEPGVAITAAALITVRPLLRALKFPGFEHSSQKTPDRQTPARTPQNAVPANSFKIPAQSSQAPEVRLQGSGSSTSVLALGVEGARTEMGINKDLFMHDGWSDEYILMEIRKTVNISINNEREGAGENYAL